MQKAKLFSEGALKIAEKRRKAKGKEGKETYTHLNAEFQRIARRDKKAFLNDQCKKKKYRKTIECARLDIFSRKLDIFYEKMGSINDRNGMVLTEAENIFKRVAGIHRRTIQISSS